MEIAYPKLVAWVLSTMLGMQSPTAPGVKWGDTYEMTAHTIAQAAMNDPFRNQDRQEVVFTAALLIVWSYREARFDPNAIGDSGSSFGLWQVKEGTAHVKRELLFDPLLAAPIALHLFHTSFHVCKDRPFEERMAQYAYGRDCEHRLELSRARVMRAREIANSWKP